MINKCEVWERLQDVSHTPVKFYLSPLQIFVLQGELTLALKHPENHGRSRCVALELLALVESALMGLGVLTSAELREIHQHDGVDR